MMDKLFGLNGLAGFALAVVVLLSVVAFLGTCAILTQQEQATNFYKIENQSDIKERGNNVADFYKNVKE